MNKTFEVTDQFLADVKDAIPNRVYLMNIDRSSELGRDQIAAIMRGDIAKVEDEIWEAFSDSRWENANEEAKDAILQVLKRDYEEDSYGEFDEIAEAILLSDDGDTLRQWVWDSDESTPVEDLMRNTPTSYKNHIRVPFSDADPTPFSQYIIAGDSDDDEIDYDRLCADLGITRTPEVIKSLNEILIELDPEDWYSAFLVASVDLEALYSIHREHGAAYGTDAERQAVTTRVAITDPFLWLTNPYMGNGYGVTVKGEFIVNLKDIRHDRAAAGYSADDVFGGLCLDRSEIKVVTEK